VAVRWDLPERLFVYQRGEVTSVELVDEPLRLEAAHVRIRAGVSDPAQYARVG